ncbi:bifunctional UDP-N-acetylglucosamine diphosphorylase/glucosamine-1-phosphate N-acetyltransferase GlmU [Desulfurobacterium thermolithotrophum]|uniref:bifunctional UDP-N-acetylglucosamine diphosphorylase/glucosamine-1-phosphate N-acetyltransferase GlmU n=1 Tax=Desulfurobacterium thermolithotrophum TaxID=64160 RepID=UPI0013D63191|nr:bifunctional UDP-N-acetylglucosamine diphosphorylase/glucosamine-1-phosphate N-acetyltransferase GlmU [Desulfurobacterium thermolithotrophum]
MSFKAVILAAGKGTRFKSDLPKVLHKILGKPMLWYVVKAAKKAGAEEIIVVVGHKKEQVEEFLKLEFPEVKTVYQEQQLGTGHAVMCAEELLKDYNKKIVVLNGDTPLVEPEEIKRLAEVDGDMVVLTGEINDPTGYGRVIRDGREILKIVEEKDATEEEKKIKEVNTGIYSFDPKKLFEALKEIDNNNAQGEYYLPDVLKVFKCKGWKVVPVVVKNFSTVMGVNNRYELSKAEKVLQERIVKALQLSGVTIHNPKSAYIEPEVEIGTDTEIFAPIYIKGKTKIGKGCYLGAFSEIVDSTIGDKTKVESHSWIKGTVLEPETSVGPFAKLRPGTYLESSAKLGTFVETKNAYLERGAKANHLTYLGDCRIGENTNIGAGTITCNYDGFNKWKTEIGKNVFVGSNTLFIAPVKVGNNSITAAGSVITSDVPENTLAVGRAKQLNYEGKAERIREKARRKKK